MHSALTRFADEFGPSILLGTTVALTCLGIVFGFAAAHDFADQNAAAATGQLAQHMTQLVVAHR